MKCIKKMVLLSSLICVTGFACADSAPNQDAFAGYDQQIYEDVASFLNSKDGRTLLMADYQSKGAVQLGLNINNLVVVKEIQAELEHLNLQVTMFGILVVLLSIANLAALILILKKLGGKQQTR